MSEADTARTVVAVVVGATAVVAVVVVLVIIALYREKRIRADLSRQAEALAALQKDIDDKRKGAAKFETLEDLMKPYKKHLLQSAFDLQSRLFQQVSNNFLHNFAKRSKRDGDYAIDSTAYFFAEFLGWLEVIRRQVVFVTGSEYAESLNSLLDSIRFQLTGERDMQGCCKDCKVNDENFDVNSDVLQLYIVDIRSIGNSMLHWDDHVHDNNRPMTVDMFLQRIKTGKESVDLVRPMTVDMFLQRIKSDDPKYQPFKDIMKPLCDSIARLASLQARAKDGTTKPPDYDETKIAPIRRLAILQVLLCKLIDILDNAVPWDFGPKYDKDDEPRYIQRDIRFTPLVKFISEKQKAYLNSQPFFEDDRSLTFRGFREDMAHMTQAERDELLWPGACPPKEPRKRDEAYKRMQPYTQGTDVGTLGLRKWNGLSAASSKPLAQVQVQQALARTRSMLNARRSMAMPRSSIGGPLLGRPSMGGPAMGRPSMAISRQSIALPRPSLALGMGGPIINANTSGNSNIPANNSANNSGNITLSVGAAGSHTTFSGGMPFGGPGRPAAPQMTPSGLARLSELYADNSPVIASAIAAAEAGSRASPAGARPSPGLPPRSPPVSNSGSLQPSSSGLPLLPEGATSNGTGNGWATPLPPSLSGGAAAAGTPATHLSLVPDAHLSPGGTGGGSGGVSDVLHRLSSNGGAGAGPPPPASQTGGAPGAASASGSRSESPAAARTSSNGAFLTKGAGTGGGIGVSPTASRNGNSSASGIPGLAGGPGSTLRRDGLGDVEDALKTLDLGKPGQGAAVL